LIHSYTHRSRLVRRDGLGANLHQRRRRPLTRPRGKGPMNALADTDPGYSGSEWQVSAEHYIWRERTYED
jgi:hypothetical protein